MKDSLLKLTVRLYNSRDIEKLDKLWEQNCKFYTTQNSFVVDVLKRGMESIIAENENVKDMLKTGKIFDEMKRLTSMLDRFVDVGYNHYKESYVIGKENQTLISRLYNIIFRIAQDKGISIDSYNRGFFDELPENFEKVTEALIKEFDVRGDT